MKITFKKTGRCGRGKEEGRREKPGGSCPVPCAKIWRLFPFWIPDWNQILAAGVLRWWLSHDGEALMSSVTALMKEIPKSWLFPSPVREHSTNEAVNGPSPDTKSAANFILDRSAFRTGRSKCLLFINYVISNSPNGLLSSLSSLEYSPAPVSFGVHFAPRVTLVLVCLLPWYFHEAGSLWRPKKKRRVLPNTRLNLQFST